MEILKSKESCDSQTKPNEDDKEKTKLCNDALMVEYTFNLINFSVEQLV